MGTLNRGESAVGINTRGITPLLVLGWISALASIVAYPYIFGVIAVTTGILSGKSGSRAGLWLIMAGIAFMAVGLIFSEIFYNYLKHILNI